MVAVQVCVRIKQSIVKRINGFKIKHDERVKLSSWKKRMTTELERVKK
jgi:hypothetical protein